MGKRLRVQRRGKGSPAYKSPSHRAAAKACFRRYDDIEKTGQLKGQITAFINCPFHQSLLMNVDFEDGSNAIMIAPEGAMLNSFLSVGATAKPTLGGVVPLKNIPEGLFIFNIENNPGDGGKMVKSPGSYASILTKEGDKVLIKLPSKKSVYLPADCRAQIGIANGAGVTELPMLTAGSAHHKRKAVNRRYPSVRGVAMNAVAHPYGGKEHHPGKGMSTSRGAPPGRKVGHIASSRTGRRSR